MVWDIRCPHISTTEKTRKANTSRQVRSSAGANKEAGPAENAGPDVQGTNISACSSGQIVVMKKFEEVYSIHCMRNAIIFSQKCKVRKTTHCEILIINAWVFFQDAVITPAFSASRKPLLP